MSAHVTWRPGVENDERPSTLRGRRQAMSYCNNTSVLILDSTVSWANRTHRACFLSLTPFSEKEEASSFHLSFENFSQQKKKCKVFFYFCYFFSCNQWNFFYVLSFYMNANRSSFCSLNRRLIFIIISHSSIMTLGMAVLISPLFRSWLKYIYTYKYFKF